MKKITFSFSIILALLLSACGSQSGGAPSGTQTSDDLPIATQMAIGTLKLADTTDEVTVDQAKELVILWQVYEGLTQSDTAAQAEIDGLVEQIQETMTNDQIQAISNLDLTQQDVFAAMQGTTVTSNPSSSTVSIPSGGSGGMPDGGGGGGPSGGGGAPPDGGGGGMPSDFSGTGATTSTSQTQTTQSDTNMKSSSGVPTALVEAVIQYLQKKVAA